MLALARLIVCLFEISGPPGSRLNRAERKGARLCSALRQSCRLSTVLSCLVFTPCRLESRNRAHTYEAWTRSSCLAIETRGQYSCTTEQRCLLPSQSAACWTPPLPLPTPSPTPTQTAARPWPRPTRARSPPAPEMPTPTLWLTPSPADLVPLMPKPSQTPRPRQATARPRS